jgi:hypothetical protein
VPRQAVDAQAQALARMLVGGISVGGLYAVSREPGKAAVEALYRLWPSASVVVHVGADNSQFTVRAVVPAAVAAGGGGGKGLSSSSSSTSNGACLAAGVCLCLFAFSALS